MNKLFYPAIFHTAEEGGFLDYISGFSGMGWQERRTMKTEDLQATVKCNCNLYHYALPPNFSSPTRAICMNSPSVRLIPFVILV